MSSLLIPKAAPFAKVGNEDSTYVGCGIPVCGPIGRQEITMTMAGVRIAEWHKAPVGNGACREAQAGDHVECWTDDLGVLRKGKAQALAQFLVTALAHILATHDVDHILGDVGRMVGNAL